MSSVVYGAIDTDVNLKSARMAEVWRHAPGVYAGKYQVSDLGRIYSLRTGKMLTGTISKIGYIYVHITDNLGRLRMVTVHGLVCETFFGPRPPGMVCDHRNAVKTDNRLVNLSWVTWAENARRAVRLGLHTHLFPAGEKNPKAKLTPDDVRAIRASRPPGVRRGVPSLKELAARYHVSTQTISRIVSRQLWKCLDDLP